METEAEVSYPPNNYPPVGVLDDTVVSMSLGTSYRPEDLSMKGMAVSGYVWKSR